ncbi:MAG: hypothetical protein V1650_00380 [Candidatus Omnitrophota bacterium]
MGQKEKLLVGGLAAVLLISLGWAGVLLKSNQEVVKDRDVVKNDNLNLNKKVEEGLMINRSLKSQLDSLGADLSRVNKDKDDIQNRLDMANKEKEDLVFKLQEQTKAVDNMKSSFERQQPVVQPAAAAPVTDDAYWASILKSKVDLEMQLNEVRNQLKVAQINSEQLAREKSSLELEVTNLTRDREDLKRQFDYNKKIMDTISQDLVREKNDKMQIDETLKIIRAENITIKKQLSTLNNRKAVLERKFTDLQKDKIELENKLGAMDSLLKDNWLQIDNLKKKVMDSAEMVDIKNIDSSKAVNNEQKGASVELAPIVVRPPQVDSARQDTGDTGESSIKILAINKDNNFVIIDAGQDAGIKVGDTFKVFRGGKAIASLETIQVRDNISACDLKNETISIKAGDSVR